MDREPRRANWILDKAKHIARLDGNDIGGLELRLRPMLGCVGVAPARKEAVATSTPGPFGGNMDYAGMNAGVKVMLPVYEPGALLFIGDGHALQGEGEVVGTGIETSLLDLYRKIAFALGRSTEPEHLPANAAELERNSLDPGKLERTFGVRPRLDLEDGLALTLPWYRERYTA